MLLVEGGAAHGCPDIGCHLMDDVSDAAVLLDHLLVVAVALLRATGLDLFAHHNINPQIFLLASGQIVDSWVLF